MNPTEESEPSSAGDAGENVGLSRTFRQYWLGSRPVCALPRGTTARVRRSAARRLVAATPRRRALRLLLQLEATIPDRLSRARGGRLGELHEMAGAGAVLDSAGVAADQVVAVFWPSQPERQRAYVHVLRQDGRPVAFLKLARGRDAISIRREEQALSAWDGGAGVMRTPRVLASGTELSSGLAWLLVEPLPETSRPLKALPAEALLNAINGNSRRHVSPENLPTLSWWSALQELLPTAPQAFREELARAVPHGVEVCSVHGDLAAHNMVTDGARVWVYDWEDSAEDAPSKTDRLGMRLFGVEPGEVLQKAHSLSQVDRRVFVWTCAFGFANNVSKWPRIVEAWETEERFY